MSFMLGGEPFPLGLRFFSTAILDCWLVGGGAGASGGSGAGKAGSATSSVAASELDPSELESSGLGVVSPCSATRSVKDKTGSRVPRSIFNISWDPSNDDVRR